jgi:hypothetical protein
MRRLAAGKRSPSVPSVSSVVPSLVDADGQRTSDGRGRLPGGRELLSDLTLSFPRSRSIRRSSSWRDGPAWRRIASPRRAAGFPSRPDAIPRRPPGRWSVLPERNCVIPDRALVAPRPVFVMTRLRCDSPPLHIGVPHLGRASPAPDTVYRITSSACRGPVFVFRIAPRA